MRFKWKEKGKKSWSMDVRINVQDCRCEWVVTFKTLLSICFFSQKPFWAVLNNSCGEVLNFKAVWALKVLLSSRLKWVSREFELGKSLSVCVEHQIWAFCSVSYPTSTRKSTEGSESSHASHDEAGRAFSECKFMSRILVFLNFLVHDKRQGLRWLSLRTGINYFMAGEVVSSKRALISFLWLKIYAQFNFSESKFCVKFQQILIKFS